MNFKELAMVNHSRAMRWHPMGLSGWSLSDWMVAAVGELGEACNVAKKLNRLRDGLQGNKIGEDGYVLKQKLADELADTVIYLDLVAQTMGLTLEDCIRNKFNAVSEREGFPERL